MIEHEANKRQGGARNSGLDVAKGDWILYVDADDFWRYDNVLTIFDYVIDSCNCNVVRSTSALVSVKSYNPQTGFIGDICPSKVDGREYFKADGFSYDVCSAVYKKEFLLKNNIRFVEGMVFEDTAWNTMLMYYAGTITLIDFPFYGYYINPNSTTRLYNNIAPFRDNARSCIEVRKVLSYFNDEAFVSKGYDRIKGTLVSLVRQSRNYPVVQTTEIMMWLRHNGLLENTSYNLSLKERCLFFSMKYFPRGLMFIVRLLMLLKRRLIKA